MQQIIKNAITGTGCSPSEARFLISAQEADLFTAASRIRTAHFGNRIQLCSIINAKNGLCNMDCRFCSQSSRSSASIHPHPLLPPRILKKKIRTITASGCRRCGIVTSGGRLSGGELRALLEPVEKISRKSELPLCASLGRLMPEDFFALRKAGISRYHHNLESSQAFYPSICSTQSWQQRADTVRAAQAAGMEVCCGGLFGLGESWDDRINLAMSLRELGITSVPINFLCPHKGTPLGEHPLLEAAEALRIIALFRFMLPSAVLRICGGRTQVLGAREADLFSAGANGLMTGDYLTVCGSSFAADLAMIRRRGLQPDIP